MAQVTELHQDYCEKYKYNIRRYNDVGIMSATQVDLTKYVDGCMAVICEAAIGAFVGADFKLCPTVQQTVQYKAVKLNGSYVKR